MKLLSLIFLTAFSSLAHAFPQEGDHARYLAVYKGETYEFKKSLITYYPERDSYLQVSKLSKGDVLLNQDLVELSSTWFYTEKKVQNVLNNCVRREGALEEILIQGQKIKTCAFYSEESQLSYSIGMVPFGQVRFQQYLGKGEFLDFHLVDFQRP